MVEAVAYQMRQRVDDAFDQALVQFGLLAEGVQADLLAQLGAHVADHAREAAEHVVHRHHADGHHRLLQVACIALQVAQATQEALVGHRVEHGRGLREHRLRDHQFAHQVDELIDLFHVDADRARLLRAAAAAAAAGARCGGRGRGR
jgi:hypothetical protein